MAVAQIPVELFVGHQHTTVDFLFFSYFKNKEGDNSRWLFFNRNRASLDYRMTPTKFLPQFGFTEAISYQHKKLKGFAPVAVMQVFSSGVFPKAGIQFARLSKHLTIFTWWVCETRQRPDLDYFLLLRFTPKLNDRHKVFVQAESINALPTADEDPFRFTQRLRVGIQRNTFQFGTGADFHQTGRTNFTQITNVGGFFRHEF